MIWWIWGQVPPALTRGYIYENPRRPPFAILCLSTSRWFLYRHFKYSLILTPSPLLYCRYDVNKIYDKHINYFSFFYPLLENSEGFACFLLIKIKFHFDSTWCPENNYISFINFKFFFCKLNPNFEAARTCNQTVYIETWFNTTIKYTKTIHILILYHFIASKTLP